MIALSCEYCAWQDRDEPAFADHVEAIARCHATFEEGVALPSMATVHLIV